VVGLSALCLIGRRRSRCSRFVPVRQGMPSARSRHPVMVVLRLFVVRGTPVPTLARKSNERAKRPRAEEPSNCAGLRECAARIAVELVARLQPASANAMSAGWSGGLPGHFGRVTMERQRRPTRQGRTRGPRRRDCMIRCPGTALSRFVGWAMPLAVGI
jgi:hypothetical protein